jgi:protein SCO1/2
MRFWRAAALRKRPQAAALVALLLAVTANAQSLNTPPRLPGKVAVAQKLGSQVPLDLMFRNERGEIVRLRDLFGKDRPVLLNFVYFNCPMLCPMTLEGTASTLAQMKLDIGKDFDVITVSIDPRDKAAKAAELKDKYVRRYGRLDAARGWHFLTGNESAIKQLTDSVGFQFAYDGVSDQFAHAAVLHVLTEDGVASRYLFGFEYKPRDLRLALIEASSRKIGTVADQLLLLCFHYDPAIGKYSRNAMNLVRAGSVTSLVALAGFIGVMVRREKQKQAR